jgi:membrane-associated phospholipid phosphatase
MNGIFVMLVLSVSLSAYADDTSGAWPLTQRARASTLSTWTEAAAVGLDLYHDLTSVPSDRRWTIAGCDGLKYGTLQFGVEGLKHLTHQARPDHTDFLSFPSGHATNAFAAINSWSWGTSVSLAVGTGYLRLAANRHRWRDVIAGAVLGSAINVGISRIPACRGTM